MPIVSGDFTASDLAQVVLKADEMWDNSMMKADFEGNVDVWKAIKAEQNANVTILEESDKDRDVRIHWVNQCDAVAEDCDGDLCDLSGAELGSDSEVYSIGECINYTFNVNDGDMRQRDLTFEEVVAKGILRADKQLSELASRTAVTRLESFKGTNQIDGGLGTVNLVSGDTDVADADWNARMFAYLYRIGIQNEFSNPFLISGTNLFEERLITMLAEANDNGKGDAALYKLMRTYFDLFNIDTVNSPDLKSYVINRGSVAFASKNRYPRTPQRYKTQDRFSLPSRNLEGVNFDVIYDNLCQGEDIVHRWKIVLRYDYFLNPTGCNEDRTGVIAFNRIP